MAKIEIPNKKLELKDLEDLGLINQGLFNVDGELAKRYNQILKNVFNYDCDIDSFRIDKRGLSPEIADYLMKKYPERLEFGENYLNMKSANRYMIVVSPDQKDSQLVAPQTSYEDELFGRVYSQARHTIEDMTASEGLFGELDNGISLFRSADDLMQMKTVRVSLDTIDGTSHAIAELKELYEGLSVGNNALDDNYISKMRSLVDKVGNVELRSISDIFPVKMEVHCFYVEFFQGVHCLRNFRNKDKLKAIFISHHQGIEDVLGDEVLSLDLHDKKVLKTLHKYKFLAYDEDLISQRIREVEDEMLLLKGEEVSDLSEHQRNHKITEIEKSLPECYQELTKLSSIVQNTKKGIDDAIENMSNLTKLKLSKAQSKFEIINHMLAELDPSDVRRVYNFNRRKFITEFPSMSKRQQRYAIQQILSDVKGGKK